MRIKMLVSMASTNRAWEPGQCYDYHDDEEAKRLIARGYAVEVDKNDQEIKTASVEAPRNAMKRGPGRPRKAEAPVAG